MVLRLPHSHAFSTSQAEDAGISAKALARLVAEGAVERLSRGWYIRIDARATEHANAINRMAQHTTPLVAAHHTAAAIHGLRVPQADSRQLFVCDPARRRPDYLPGIVLLPATIGRRDVIRLDGLRVTTLERTALDLARGCSLEYALVPIDHAYALGASKGKLIAARRRMHGWPGTRVLDRALAVADARAESALESMSRGAIIAAGLPHPVLQREVRGRSGRRWRADFVWEGAGVIGESDGFGKYSERGQFELEKFRDSDLRAAGWTVVHWTFEQMLLGDRPALRWLEQALGVRASADPGWLHSSRPPSRRRVAGA